MTSVMYFEKYFKIKKPMLIVGNHINVEQIIISNSLYFKNVEDAKWIDVICKCRKTKDCKICFANHCKNNRGDEINETH